MATHRVRRNVQFLEEWIDGTTIKKLGVSSGDDRNSTGSTWNLYDHILQLFSTLVPLASKSPPVVSKKDTRSLKESLGRLYLWGDGFGDGRLEFILEESDDLKETVVTLLIVIGKILISSKLYRHRSTLKG
jgi:hypothetical protein